MLYKSLIRLVILFGSNTWPSYAAPTLISKPQKIVLSSYASGLAIQSKNPAVVGLAIRDNNGTFEILDLVPYSTPPDLLDMMKSQERNRQEQAK
ncbi:hypothetical protein GWI33_004983 [Rhynchophorus ferrugineus]|uniref:Uncharacterized protein n=1 Tax=Rhynchophorus ferrugineus TaxID=354439 RepID=A0A834MK30_RHYFE|nr:hypothetical protein GWI33_004983 [Rhynchophorus ferrugineus]